METVTTTQTSNSCKQHKITFSICTYEGCNQKELCKFCCLGSKEGVQHLNDHFESLKDLHVPALDSSIKVKEDDLYSDMNKAYKEYFQIQIHKNVENIFNEVALKKVLVIDQCLEFVNSNYDGLTTDFEQVVKLLTEKVGNLNTHDSKAKDEVKKLKVLLDEKLNMISNPANMTKELDTFRDKLESKLKKMTLEDFLNNKFNFANKKNSLNTEWENSNSIVNVTTRGSSYWCIKSKETIEGPLICKIVVKKINDSYTNSYWNYCFGLARPTISSESSYYNDCVLLQSNGYLPTKFSGSGSGKQIFFTTWKNGDEIYVKRDENGNVFFSVNSDSNYVLAFDGIIGPMKIVMGFSTSMTGDIFEMEELEKL